jgi:hypothetical protein
MRRKILTLGLLAGLVFARGAQATLLDRGSGLIYDTVLNITWTQNANLCVTLGNCIPSPGPAGVMTWDNAKAWADNLVFDGFSDWRLATVSSTSPTTTPDKLQYGNRSGVRGERQRVGLHVLPEPERDFWQLQDRQSGRQWRSDSKQHSVRLLVGYGVPYPRRVGLRLRLWRPVPRRQVQRPRRLGRPPWRFGGGTRAGIGSVDGIGAVRVASGTAVAGSVIWLLG